MIPKNKECPKCGKEIKVKNECISHPTFREECYNCHLHDKHLNLDEALDNGTAITTGPSVPPEGPQELPKKVIAQGSYDIEVAA